MAQTKINGDQSTTLPNIADIQAMLWEQVLGLRDGKTTPTNANAIANSVGKIFTSVKLQIEYHRLTGGQLDIPFLLTSGK